VATESAPVDTFRRQSEGHEAESLYGSMAAAVRLPRLRRNTMVAQFAPLCIALRQSSPGCVVDRLLSGPKVREVKPK
jgi:hypothetical protein